MPSRGGPVHRQSLTIWPVGGGSIDDSAKYPGLFAAAARGLGLLASPGIFRVPLTIACTILDERHVLVLEWIPQGARDTRFGGFGGTACRLASKNGLLPATARDRFQRPHQQLPAIFEPEPPAVLHGDLWSGNFLCDDQWTIANLYPLLIHLNLSRRDLR